MKVNFARLWNEETGAIVSAEIVLVMTILVIGMIVGLGSLRDAIVTELADVAQAIANLDQSYSYCGIVGHSAFSGGGSFTDRFDFCDTANANDNASAQHSKCVTVCTTVTHVAGSEGSVSQ